jgi:hypothetical protein
MAFPIRPENGAFDTPNGMVAERDGVKGYGLSGFAAPAVVSPMIVALCLS